MSSDDENEKLVTLDFNNGGSNNFNINTKLFEAFIFINGNYSGSCFLGIYKNCFSNRIKAVSIRINHSEKLINNTLRIKVLDMITKKINDFGIRKTIVFVKNNIYESNKAPLECGYKRIRGQSFEQFGSDVYLNDAGKNEHYNPEELCRTIYGTKISETFSEEQNETIENE